MSVTPAREWREANRKEVVLSSGRTVLIRKLTAEFLLSVREIFEKYLVAGDQATSLKLPAAEQRRYFEALVCEAVVRPRVVPADREPDEAELNPVDFGPELDELVGKITEFNEGILVAPFRPASDGGAAEPDREGVRSATEPAASGESGGPTA